MNADIILRNALLAKLSKTATNLSDTCVDNMVTESIDKESLEKSISDICKTLIDVIDRLDLSYTNLESYNTEGDSNEVL